MANMQPARTPLPAGLHVWHWDYFTRILSRPYLHFYYRYMYGHAVPLARAFAKLARFMEERIPLGNIPLPKEMWDSQYRRGHWDFMASLEQAARYSVVGSYFLYLKRGGKILDVGCGEGLLQKYLGTAAYSRYLGIDISRDAISRAVSRADERTTFVCADLRQYTPEGSFDAVVFSEVLYYVDDPLQVMESYVRCLERDGIVILSIFSSARGNAIWRQVKDWYRVMDEVKITSKSKSWICRVVAPCERHGRED